MQDAFDRIRIMIGESWHLAEGRWVWEGEKVRGKGGGGAISSERAASSKRRLAKR